MDNTSLPPVASNIVVACDFRLRPRPTVPRVILDDLCGRIGHLADKELRSGHLHCLGREHVVGFPIRLRMPSKQKPSFARLVAREIDSTRPDVTTAKNVMTVRLVKCGIL